MGVHFFLFCILLILCFINISLTLAITQNDDLSLPLQLKFAQMEERMADQNRETLKMEISIAGQNSKIAMQNTKLCELESKIELLEKSKTSVTSTESLTVKVNAQLAYYFNLSQDIQNIKNNISKIENTEVKDQLAYSNLSRDIEQTKVTTENIKDKILKIENSNRSSGVVFTRWGREDCPVNISTSVYNGRAGGSSFKHTGGGVNYLCMPQDPIWDNNKDHKGIAWGYVYGAEYQYLPDSSLSEHDVPCAVCRATSFSTRIMIPGRNKCYEGWTLAYAGELTSGYHAHKAASEYACLDAKPQKKGYRTSSDGVLFYPVRARCGSLPCGPYEDNKLLTCVVCLK